MSFHLCILSFSYSRNPIIPESAEVSLYPRTLLQTTCKADIHIPAPATSARYVAVRILAERFYRKAISCKVKNPPEAGGQSLHTIVSPLIVRTHGFRRARSGWHLPHWGLPWLHRSYVSPSLWIKGYDKNILLYLPQRSPFAESRYDYNVFSCVLQ